MSIPIQRRPSPVRRFDGGCAAAERVEHQIAGVGACRDDALQQRQRFLRRVAHPLGGRIGNTGDVGPYVLQRLSLRLIQVNLQSVHAWRAIGFRPDAPFVPPCFELFEVVTPSARGAGHCSPPVELPGRRVGPGGGEIFQLVAPSVAILVAEAAQLGLSVILVLGVPGRVGRLCVVQQYIRDVAVAIGGVVALGALPRYLVPEVLVPENRVHHDLDVMAGGRVAVEVNRAGRFEQAAHGQEPLHHVGEVGQHARIVSCASAFTHSRQNSATSSAMPASRMRIGIWRIARSRSSSSIQVSQNASICVGRGRPVSSV